MEKDQSRHVTNDESFLDDSHEAPMERLERSEDYSFEHYLATPVEVLRTPEKPTIDRELITALTVAPKLNLANDSVGDCNSVVEVVSPDDESFEDGGWAIVNENTPFLKNQETRPSTSTSVLSIASMASAAPNSQDGVSSMRPRASSAKQSSSRPKLDPPGSVSSDKGPKSTKASGFKEKLNSFVSALPGHGKSESRKSNGTPRTSALATAEEIRTTSFSNLNAASKPIERALKLTEYWTYYTQLLPDLDFLLEQKIRQRDVPGFLQSDFVVVEEDQCRILLAQSIIPFIVERVLPFRPPNSGAAKLQKFLLKPFLQYVQVVDAEPERHIAELNVLKAEVIKAALQVWPESAWSHFESGLKTQMKEIVQHELTPSNIRIGAWRTLAPNSPLHNAIRAYSYEHAINMARILGEHSVQPLHAALRSVVDYLGEYSIDRRIQDILATFFQAVDQRAAESSSHSGMVLDPVMLADYKRSVLPIVFLHGYGLIATSYLSSFNEGTLRWAKFQKILVAAAKMQQNAGALPLPIDNSDALSDDDRAMRLLQQEVSNAFDEIIRKAQGDRL